jgi:hypothetical protein
MMSAMLFFEESIRFEYQDVQMRMGWLTCEPAILPNANGPFPIPVVFSLLFSAGRSYDTGKKIAVQILNRLFKSQCFTQRIIPNRLRNCLSPMSKDAKNVKVRSFI